MTIFPRFFIIQLLLLFPFASHCQFGTGWLVEMNTTTGSFEAVGPSVTDESTMFVNLQCKDETNGQYIFMKPDSSYAFASVDITNAQIIAETSHPLGYSYNLLGFYCYQNCDSLLLIQRHPTSYTGYVAFFDRFNGTELMQFGDSIPNDNPVPGSASPIDHAFDRFNNLLYLYSKEASLLRVMDIPSGEIINTYPTSLWAMFLTFDEINNKLYALERMVDDTYRLLVFDPEIGEFMQIGDSFLSLISGNYTPTIDGNNQRMFVTSVPTFYGSCMTSIDLITGELLADVQTVPNDPFMGIYGLPNTHNGQYFNSTDQLITLHWGEGSSIISSTNAQPENELKARVYPNPNQGVFEIDLGDYSREIYDLKILNVKGQIVYENNHLRKGERLNIDLASGYYIANILDANGLLFERIPFLVDSGR